MLEHCVQSEQKQNTITYKSSWSGKPPLILAWDILLQKFVELNIKQKNYIYFSKFNCL